MKNQKGAALIVVLSLLTISLMVGLSSMQSSQIDERLAGNYRAASEAYMVAEKAASELLEIGETPVDVKTSCVHFSNNPGLDDWLSFSEGMDVEGYQSAKYRSCEYAGHGPAFIVMGESGDAVRFLAFSPEGKGGGNPVKDIVDDLFPNGERLFDYALLVGGALAINGGADIAGSVRVGGAYKGNKNKDEIDSIVVNDNDNIISDYGYAGLHPSQEFFSRVEDLEGLTESSGGCSNSATNSVVFCKGNASFTFDDINGMSVVATGNVSVTGKTEGQEVFVVAGGSVDFSGMGGNKFRGVVWSGGSLVFNGQGGTSYEGSFVTAGSSSFNGGLDIKQLDFEDAAPTSGGDMLWKEM